MPASTNVKENYTIHPSVQYGQSILKNLPDKTGKSLQQWLKLVRESGTVNIKARREWLKKKHRLGGTTAALIAERSLQGRTGASQEDAYLEQAVAYVEAMYSGAKSALWPLHDRLIKTGQSFGDDVGICPCKTIVPLYRKHVFAEIKPTTRTRIDLGLCLRETSEPLSTRLIDTGGLRKGDRITHRFAISTPTEIDHEVLKWFRIAYDQDR